MEFNSQICTTKEQSERLLKLGVKAETADMTRTSANKFAYDFPYIASIRFLITNKGAKFSDIEPAWSLHRLIEMIPMLVNPIRNLFVSNRSIEYQMSEGRTTLVFANENNIYDNVINCIEWLISVDEFNKNYLNIH